MVWRLLYPSMPLKIIESFDTWYKVEDSFGDQGWIHKSLLSRRRYLIVEADTALRNRHRAGARPVARIQKGAIVSLRGIYGDWFYVSAGGYRGYIPRRTCWAHTCYS